MKLRSLVVVVCMVCVCVFATAGCAAGTFFGIPIGGGGQQAKSEDAAAKSLVRNSMTAIESAFVDLRTFEPATMTPSELILIEPTIEWTVATSAEDAFHPVGCPSEENEVRYWGTVNTYAVGTESESDTTFGVYVDKGAGGGNTFYIDGEAVSSW